MPARPFRLMDIWLVAVSQTRVFFANKTNSLMLGKYATIADGFFSASFDAVIHNLPQRCLLLAHNEGIIYE
ncbi:hypothetical protein [Pantoea dispersa]|uniref:hypothetical protein n=1 Tax=Pantoea dispersa TaxID=59814 RepID=UPI0021CA4260|nr:hypothetical protein [Pantoea dispersa]